MLRMMLSLGFVGGPNPLGHRTYMGIIYWLPFFLSRTAWRDGWREIGIPTSEGCLWYTLRRWYRLSLEVFHIKYGYYVQAWAARGSKHQQTRKMNSELIRKKLRTNCSNMSFKRKLRCIWDTRLGVFLSPVYIWSGLSSNTTLWIMR